MRRLPIALGLAIVVSSLCATAAWFFLPSPTFTAQAKLIVRSRTPQIASHSGADQNTGEDYKRYQKTQLNLIKSYTVINAALQQPKVSRLKMIKELRNPIEWLQENLKVEFPQESEVMDISLGGNDPQEVAQVVNAIQTSYMEEVANTDLKQRKERQDVALRERKRHM